MPILEDGGLARWHELGLQPLQACTEAELCLCRTEDGEAIASFLAVSHFSLSKGTAVQDGVTRFVLKDYSALNFEYIQGNCFKAKAH